MEDATVLLSLLIGFIALFGVQAFITRRHRNVEDKVLKGYFLLGLSGLMANIAMADGKLTADESDLAMKFFHGMKLGEAEKAVLIGNFISSAKCAVAVRDHAHRFLAYATPAACEFLFSLLWRLTAADGRLDEGEDRMMRDIAAALGLDTQLYERLKAGATPSFSAATLRAAGVPESLVALA